MHINIWIILSSFAIYAFALRNHTVQETATTTNNLQDLEPKQTPSKAAPRKSEINAKNVKNNRDAKTIKLFLSITIFFAVSFLPSILYVIDVIGRLAVL